MTDADLFRLPLGLREERVRERRTLLHDFDQLRRDLDSSGAMEAMDRYGQQAVELVVGRRAQAAFDLSREPDRVRERYVIAAEGKAPDLVVEVLSQSSTDNGDLTRKRDTYQGLGVREYVVIDPLGKFAPEPRLQGWRFRISRGPLNLARCCVDTRSQGEGQRDGRVDRAPWGVKCDHSRARQALPPDV